MKLSYPCQEYAQVGDIVSDGDRQFKVASRSKSQLSGLVIYYSADGQWMTEATLRHPPHISEWVDLVHAAMREDAANNNTLATQYVLAALEIFGKARPDLRLPVWQALTPQQQQYLKKVKEMQNAQS